MIDTVGFFKRIAQSFDCSVKITAVQVAEDLYEGTARKVRYFSPYMKWLRLGMFATTEAGTAKCIEITSEYFVLVQTSVWTTTDVPVSGGYYILSPDVISHTATIQRPLFMYGTQAEVSDQLSKITQSESKSPLIFLRKLLREQQILNNSSSIEITASPRVSFLDGGDYAKTYAQMDSEVIQRMVNLAAEFEAKMTTSGEVSRNIGQIDTIKESKFGAESDRGTGANKLAGAWAGITRQYNELQFFKQCN